MPRARQQRALTVGWIVSAGLAATLRVWNAVTGPMFYGYDAWGHISYVFFLDMYHALPWADQGWSYFHPPLHYLFGWALMQFGSPDVLVIGLALLGSVASLGVAGLAAGVVRVGFPERPGYALLAFSAIAFLPVHVYTSPMPGNEMTATFFAAAAFAAHLRNETRSEPTIAGDLLTGVLAALAMLSKFSDLIAVLAIGALSAWLWLRAGPDRDSSLRLARRAVAIAIPILVIAGPWYSRNLVEFGTPFMTSAKVPDVHRIQASQPPGERHAIDYLRFPPAVFDESVPSAPHMVNAVWPNTYLNVWFDTFHEGQLPFPRDIIPHPFIHQLTIFFGMLGLVPTVIALLGALSSARRGLRGSRNTIDLGMCILAGGTLAAYILFSIRIPTWAALKASYLLNLSLPFAWFLVRGAAALSRRDSWLGAIAPTSVALIAACVSFVFAAGKPPGLMRRAFDSTQMHQLRAHFGHYEDTRKFFGPDEPLRSYLEARAAVELFDGRPRLARRFYEHADRLAMKDPQGRPYWLNRLAISYALDNHPERARMLLDEALDTGAFAELIVNRAVLGARAGDWKGAEAQLRQALELDPLLPPAWSNLASVLSRLDRRQEAADARARFEEVVKLAPRGFPHGIGNGFLYESGAGQRYMLVLDEAGEISIYAPPRARNRPRPSRASLAP